MTGHTPGPWRKSDVAPYIIEAPFPNGPRGPESRRIVVLSPGLNRDEQEANARVICAAPDLLAGALDLLRYYDSDDGLEWEAIDILVGNIRSDLQRHGFLPRDRR